MINTIETGKSMYRIGIGKYNSKCNIDEIRKVDMIILNVLLKIGLGEKDETNDNNMMINPNYLKYIPYAKKDDMHKSLIIDIYYLYHGVTQ